MNHTLSIYEYQPPVWKKLALISLIIAVISFGASWVTSNILWASIFQLVAFSAFTGTVLAFLQFRTKPQKITLQVNSNHLTIDYQLQNDNLKEELFERDTIKKIEKLEVVFRWDFFSMLDGYKYIISFTDTKNELSVFTFSGRDLYISAGEAAVLDNFLDEHNLSGADK